VGFDPDAMTLRRALAEAQLAAGDAAGAETTLARVVARCPWRCEALLARVALEAGDMTLAARRARDLLARPSAGRPHAVAGGLATGQPPVEEREREDALGERESRTAAGYVLGLALARLGEPAQARAALAEVLRREPTHRGARQALRALEPEPEPEG
jgi:hypothetical protein